MWELQDKLLLSWLYIKFQAFMFIQVKMFARMLIFSCLTQL